MSSHMTPIGEMDREHFMDTLSAELGKVLEKAIPRALLAHERQKYIRMGMSTDLTFYAPVKHGDGFYAIQSFASLPELPPLPEIGGRYTFKEDKTDSDKAPQHFVVKNIVYKYRYIAYESAPSIPEFVTEVNVYLEHH